MSRRIIRSDPGDEQAHLFSLASVNPKTCSCGTTKRNLCVWAANRHHFGIDARQPRTCLLRYDQAKAEIPF